MMNPQSAKNKSRGVSRDMSPEAILRRLEIVSELRTLSLWLGTAKKVNHSSDLKFRFEDRMQIKQK